MKLSRISVVFCLAACAPSSTHPATVAPATLDGPASRVVELPATPGAGEPREVRVLIDEPALKLATIVLRPGAKLPEHRTSVPVTITALQGSGVVVVGNERLRVDAGHAVVLQPSVAHAVEPDDGSALVLLVHHLGRAEAEAHHH